MPGYLVHGGTQSILHRLAGNMTLSYPPLQRPFAYHHCRPHTIGLYSPCHQSSYLWSPLNFGLLLPLTSSFEAFSHHPTPPSSPPPSLFLHPIHHLHLLRLLHPPSSSSLLFTSLHILPLTSCPHPSIFAPVSLQPALHLRIHQLPRLFPIFFSVGPVGDR